MTKTYELPNEKMIMADVDEKHHTATVSVYALDDLVEAVNKTGHWIRELIRNEKGGCIGAKMICSECGNDNKHDEYMIYCPNCGAKMDERREVRDKV